MGNFYPGKLLAFARLDRVVPRRNMKKMEMNAVFRVIVGVHNPRAALLGINAELFLKFSLKRLFRRFMAFYFSSGKLPPTCPGLVGRTLRQKQLPLPGLNEPNSNL